MVILLAALCLGRAVAAEKEDVDIRMEASIEKTGYVGQAMEYVVVLKSTSPDISNVRIVKGPDFPEDATVIKGIARNSRPEEVREGGKTYYKWTILRDFIIPRAEGSFSVGECSFIAFIPHETIVSHGFWGNQRVVRYEEKKIECRKVNFKVKRLPGGGDAGSFSGSVGSFSVEGWFPPGYITSGTEAFVVFTISGYGSLSDFRLPNISKIFSTGCRLVEVERDDEQMQRDGRLFSEITLTCRFFVDEEDFEIEPLCLSFFNPATGKYYDSCSETLQWSPQAPKKKNGGKEREAIAI